MGSLSEQRTTTVDSDAAAQLRRVKHALTLDLFLQRGSFWESVEVVRNKWEIAPTVGMPQRDEFGYVPHPSDWTARPHSAEWIKKSSAWSRDLDNLLTNVPPRFRNPDYFLLTWRPFFAACVLYDPPETGLLRFAEYGGPRPLQVDSGHLRRAGPPRQHYPVIHELRNWVASEDLEHGYWALILAELGRRLRPQGIDVDQLVEEILSEKPWITEWRRQTEEQFNPFRGYIDADDEYTTEEDIRAALRMRRAQQGIKLQKGGQVRDPLVAVQCAILYDRHNCSLPSDRRQRKWTHKSLAEHLALRGKRNQISVRAAEAHIELGRKILRDKA